MKKLYLVLFALAVIVVSGCSTTGPDYTNDNVADGNAGAVDTGGDVVDSGNTAPIVTGDEASRKVIVDRSNYVTPGKDLYDTATVNFVQAIGKGFEVTITANSAFEASLMTAGECLARTRKEESVSIEDGQGTEITFLTDLVSEEKRNLCVYLKVIGTSEDSEQLQMSTTVNEITFA